MLGEAFRRYERIRMPRTARIVDRSWRFGQVATWERDSLVWMKETMARLTPGTLVKAELRRQILESAGTL